MFPKDVPIFYTIRLSQVAVCVPVDFPFEEK